MVRGEFGRAYIHCKYFSGLMFYVSPESNEAKFQVITSRSDGVNILLSNGDSFEEVPIPDQFKTTFTNNEPNTVPVEHA